MDPDPPPPPNDAIDFDSGSVEHGIRQSRRRTNFARRDSSSLYPAQFMELEVYTAASEEALRMALGLLPLVSLFMSLCEAKRSALRLWESSSNAVAAVGARLHAQLSSLLGALLELNFLLLSICAHGELVLLYVYDLTHYICDRRPLLTPEKRRCISKLSCAD